jgi:hypothetical protein
MKTLTKVTGGFRDSTFICKWDDLNAEENQKANDQLEPAAFLCGVSPITFHVIRDLGRAIFTGWQIEVSCVWNDLQKNGWKHEGAQEAANGSSHN